jgi:hypothetical protein
MVRGDQEPELGFEPRTCCLQDSCSSQLSYPGGPAHRIRARWAIGSRWPASVVAMPVESVDGGYARARPGTGEE